MGECVALLRLGVHFDLAFSMDAELRAAILIADGQNQGGEFDWGAWGWRKREA